MFWMTAFLDLPAEELSDGLRFWRALTGYDLSSARGDQDEFVTLVPPTGSDFLRLQRLGGGPARVHIDLHAEDIETAAAAAVAAGARRLEQVHSDVVILASPGGLTFCLVTHSTRERPLPTTWPDGHSSFVDQVCIDLPSSVYDVECSFWRDVTGFELTHATGSPEFSRLVPPPSQHLRVLLQRLDETHGPVRAHLDWSTTDRAAETARHLAVGAEVVREHPHWTVMSGPVGPPYCITDRSPDPAPPA